MSSTRCSTWRRTAAKWRALPEQFGNWHTIYTRLRRWAAAGVLDRAFQALQEHRLIRIRVEVCRLGQHRGLERVAWSFQLAAAAYHLIHLPKLLETAT
jgi:transposase